MNILLEKNDKRNLLKRNSFVIFAAGEINKIIQRCGKQRQWTQDGNFIMIIIPDNVIT